MDKQLRKIATASRREMEKFSREHSEYNYDGLACLCAISSYFLAMVGRQFGYHLTLVEGLAFDEYIEDLLWDDECCEPPDVNHCWVEYKGKIIDLTATQFDDSVRKVHIVDADSENYWPINRHNEARRRLKTWPDDQSPYYYIKELRKGVARIKTKLAA